MNIATLIDFSLHLIFTSIIIYYTYKKWGEPVSAFFGGITGGILIDSDHLIDYFFAYGAHINMSTFLNGYEFLASRKLHIFFHAWEYVIGIIIILLFIDRRKTTSRVFLIALAMSMFFHLVIDTSFHRNAINVYSILHRSSVHFDLEKLSTPEQIIRQNKIRREMEFNNVK